MNRNRFALLSLRTLMLLLLYKRNSPFDHVTFCHRNVICVSDKSYACSHGSLCTYSSLKVHREQDLFCNKGGSMTAPLDRVNSQFWQYKKNTHTHSTNKHYYLGITLKTIHKNILLTLCYTHTTIWVPKKHSSHDGY